MSTEGTPQLPELFDGQQACYVEVAMPVPVRRAFTYRLPEPLRARVAVGARVAVPFRGRKLSGFVVANTSSPPDDVARVRDVAGLLDDEPVFSQELLHFLREAAEYYLHPLGEVLRAAAPALPKNAMKALRRDGFLDPQERLPGRSVSRRTTLVAHPTEEARGGGSLPKLGKRQRAALDALCERGEASADDLRAHVPEPRETLRRLQHKGLVVLQEHETPADPLFRAHVPGDRPPDLNDAQRTAVQAIVSAMPATPADAASSAQHPAGEGGGEGAAGAKPAAFLLHGVTGSGKTEVYLQAIAEARARELGALVLVPEIALTPQLVARFRARFGDAIAVLHSGLSERERDAAWRRLRSGEVKIAVGARSALFAPVPDPAIVIVDEEHDPSFKQEEGFRYHARDMALLRAHRAGAVAVLGSATPSVETYHRAQRGRMQLLTLPERATAQQLPDVEIVDLRRHGAGPSGDPLLSGPLYRALEQCLSNGEQAILFLNRRGFTPHLRCTACGEPVQCPACSVALTEHRRAGVLRCHYCDFSTPVAERCASCGVDALERLGLGTEKLEETLDTAFSQARVARLDRDTATGRSLEAVLERLRQREIDILVGTQMVTKGHDLPGVTLVGVVLADQALGFPDFRAAERTFQQLSQVAGRAGRGERAGRVLLQSFQPEHPAIQYAAKHDYAGFYRAEIEARRELRYAPFSRLVAVRVDAGDERRARQAAHVLADVAKHHAGTRQGQVQVLGPAPAPLARLRGRWRFRLLLRSADRRMLRTVAAAIVERIDEGLSPARAHVDVDPVSML